mmetsp:Transcript_19267/g.45854  ORF Transcript_19267/g.45854 Transcript_19267/m.45854 type:complete len:133 (-) Transcript_19267:115-513(-)
MDQRIVQVSRTVEELMQASYDLLESSEQEDTQQATRHQPIQHSHAPLEQLLLCHRQANGAVERLITDLQQADVMVRRLHTQGWHYSSMSQIPSSVPKGHYPPPPHGSGKWNPQEQAAALDALEEEMNSCLIP